ncbi:hypothetical protein A7E78_05345 [Syntrophotalea acetylenivorans]|uniref:Flagellar assembly protein FliH n=1 Tax=Syntrophotalea acetylenivorans TaxID=1842532 RepID=A0A1L3GN02_9BACT|nr:flagellar assembly protein FliH [Syntrophotalea acetylenivorans]APG27317.1 hypothetical protein A7E78_05345 [Syntrophotalea acetylenivorans]
MLSSKIYRSSDTQGLKRISFREFGDNGQVVEDGLLFEDDVFSEEAVPPPQPEHPEQPEQPPEPPSAPPADLGKQIEEAYLQGKEEGQQEIQLQFGSSLEMLAHGIEEVSRLRATLLQNSSQDMLRLVLSIARQVIHGEVSLNRELILTTIDKALRAAVRSDHYHIKVHPDDLALVTENKPFFITSINGLESITLEGDQKIARGGCQVESDLGAVDATIDGQLEEIRRTLLSTMEQG